MEEEKEEEVRMVVVSERRGSQGKFSFPLETKHNSSFILART